MSYKERAEDLDCDDLDNGLHIGLAEEADQEIRVNNYAMITSNNILREKLEAKGKAIKLLTDCETCPCGDVGYFVVCGVDGEPEQEQCQFCYETKNSRFNALRLTNKEGE